MNAIHDAAHPTLRREPPILSVAALDRDPHGLYRRLRPVTPLIRRDNGSYIAIRACDVEQLATDPRTRQSETDYLRLRGITSGPLFETFSNWMLFSNGREHRRRRLPMSRAFAFKLIVALRPKIRALAHALIARHVSRGSMSFIDDFAALLPAHLICTILGLPESDIPRFTHWVYSVSRAVGLSFLDEELGQINADAEQLQRYTGELLDSRRRAPQEDFLSSFVAAVEQEGTLSPAEALAQVVLLILAGSDTTRGAMAVQVSLLLEHREQWQAVCADEALIPGAVSEALRYEPIAASIPRVTLEDLRLDPYVIPRDSFVSLSTMAAMRDPALYDEPDTFCIRRSESSRRHLVFGAGAHRCLGEALARAELEEGLTALVQRLPQLQLAGDPLRLKGHSGIRRPTPMPVSWPA